MQDTPARTPLVARADGAERIMPHIEDVTDEFEASSLLEKSGAREAAEEGDCSHSAKHTADDGSKPDDAAASGVTVSNGGDKSTTDVAPKKLTEEDRERQEVLLEKARAIKQEGNTLFGEGQYEEALSKYTEAIEVAPDGHKEQAVYYNNRATCHFKLNRTDDVIADCSAALRIDSDYTKCLLRRAQARAPVSARVHCVLPRFNHEGKAYLGLAKLQCGNCAGL